MICTCLALMFSGGSRIDNTLAPVFRVQVYFFLNTKKRVEHRRVWCLFAMFASQKKRRYHHPALVWKTEMPPPTIHSPRHASWPQFVTYEYPAATNQFLQRQISYLILVLLYDWTLFFSCFLLRRVALRFFFFYILSRRPLRVTPPILVLRVE